MATHAAGVVIAGSELSDQIPLYIDHSSKLPYPQHSTICTPLKMLVW